MGFWPIREKVLAVNRGPLNRSGGWLLSAITKPICENAASPLKDLDWARQSLKSG